MLSKSLLVTSLFALTITTATADDGEKAAFGEKLTRLTGIQVVAVEEAPVDDVWQIVTREGIFYATKDGEHIFSGALHRFANGFYSLSNERLAIERGTAIEEQADTFLTFEAENEKHKIVVFYDTTCGFCQRMHGNLDDYLAQGITISYAAFPRAGLNSQAAQQLNNVFCAEDPHQALDDSLQGAVPNSSCDDRVQAHFKLGEQLNVRGTPAIYTMDGIAVEGGAIPADQLIGKLNAL